MKTSGIKVAFIVIGLCSPVLVFSHPGGLDGSGGHRDRKHGGYHYHQGQSNLTNDFNHGGKSLKQSSNSLTQSSGPIVTDVLSSDEPTPLQEVKENETIKGSALPEKLKGNMRGSTDKSRVTFGGVSACICGDRVLFTNVVCYECKNDGEKLQEIIAQSIPVRTQG